MFNTHFIPFDSEDLGGYSYCWFHVAFVCRYWRSIILSTPELFSQIDLSFPLGKYGSSWLSYSKQASLRLLGALDRNYDAWTLIFPHMERIESLKVRVQ